MTFLGIDLGTSGLRALLVSKDGETIGSAEVPLCSQKPMPSWSEQDPLHWVEALETAITQLAAKHPEFKKLKGIGVSGHMHGATLLDAKNDVIRPCILWNDTRSHVQASTLDANPDFRALSGNIVFPGFTAPKLEWLREHEPKNYDRINKVLLPAAYLNFYLTGDFVSDMSDCSGTAWLNVQKRSWSTTLLQAGGMDKIQMPDLVEGNEVAGFLRPEILSNWDVQGPVVVAGGAGDNAAAACGMGALGEGQGFVSLGTSGVLLVARDGYKPAPEKALHTFCHAVPKRWYQMGVMLSATDSLNWLSRISGKSPSDLTGALGENIRTPSSVQFLPYLSGERTPHNDANIRGSFIGLGTETSLEDLTQAVLEGVAFGLRDSAEALKATGVSMDRLWAIGGGTASPYWLQVLSTVLDVPLLIPEDGDFGAAFGAARLAQCAATSVKVDVLMLEPKLKSIIKPNPLLATDFENAYERFRLSYSHLKNAQQAAETNNRKQWWSE